jgi:hypothetical protein
MVRNFIKIGYFLSHVKVRKSSTNKSILTVFWLLIGVKNSIIILFCGAKTDNYSMISIAFILDGTRLVFKWLQLIVWLLIIYSVCYKVGLDI